MDVTIYGYGGPVPGGLNVGDIITYVPCTHVQSFANPMWVKQSSVLSIDPEAEQFHKVELLSRDVLYDDHCIWRSQINYKGNLIKHPGVKRDLDQYNLTSQLTHRGQSLKFMVGQSLHNLRSSLRKSIDSTPSHIRPLTEAHTNHILSDKAKKKAPGKRSKKYKIKLTRKKAKKVSKKSRK